MSDSCDRRAESVLGLVGGTPLVKLRRVASADGATVWGKLEAFNPGGSVKDRIGLSMIEAAEEAGQLKPGGVIIEPTSGNTGIALALVAAAKGYKLIVTMPETMTRERIELMRLYGAEIVLTPGPEGMAGAVNRANELLAKTPGAFMPQQFDNPANPAMHYRTTGPEIVRAMEGKVDGFVAGIGTGGTITGAGKYLREKCPGVRIVAVEPAGSPLLSGGKAGPHGIQGIGANFVPKVLDQNVYDEVVAVRDDEAKDMMRRLAAEEGVSAGVSSGAAVWAAVKVAAKIEEGKNVVVVLPDDAMKYVSLLSQ